MKMKPTSYIPAVLILKERNKLMQSRNKHRSLVLSSTFVGLVCGLVLTHQQAYAAQTLPVNNQESQITAVAAPENNLSKTAAVNQDYSFENENIANPAASGHVTPSTYSSLQTNAITKQSSSLQTTNSDATAAAPTPNTGATGPVDNGTATSTNPENNNLANPATSSPSPDTDKPATTTTTGADNPTTTAASSEQPETNIIAQGTWGTSKWDYTQEGADYILHLHAGTLGTPEEHPVGKEGIGSLNAAFTDQLTQIIIDPGVVANQDSRGLFSHLYNLKTIQGLENLDTSQVTNMSDMFVYCESLHSLDLINWDTSQVTDMNWMFYCCTGLTNLDVSHFDTSQVTNMSAMFEDCYNLTSLDVSHWDTSQVTMMELMFVACNKLTDLDVSHWDTSQVTNMTRMFEDCWNLTSLDASHWDTSQVTDMNWMFYACHSLTNLDVSHFDTSQVTDMYLMFSSCKSLTSLDLSSFDTSQVTNETLYIDDFAMLVGCTNLHHLVLGPKTKLIDQNGKIADLPAVPAAGTKIPGTDRVVTAPYWVATNGYQQGQRYTSDELQQLTDRDQVTTYDWAS